MSLSWSYEPPMGLLWALNAFHSPLNSCSSFSLRIALSLSLSDFDERPSLS